MLQHAVVLLTDRKAIAPIEYAVLAAGILGALLTAFTTLDGAIRTTFTTITGSLGG